MKYLLLIPAVVLCVIFTLWPMAEVIIMSFQRTHFMGDTWVGFANYANLLTDYSFKRAMLNSVWYIVLFVPLQVGVAVFVTMLACRLSKRWQDVTRVVVYIPCMAAGMVIASIWSWIWHLEGPVNWILGTRFNFFTQSVTAIPAISITTASVGIGGYVIMLVATTLAINKDLFDAAMIDGANNRQIKLRIILPIIMPMVWICVLLSAINAPQVIEYIIALAPYEHAATVSFDIYNEAFILGRYGPAAAKAMILLIWMLAMAWGKTRLAREK